jgi:hypothetical protein
MYWGVIRRAPTANQAFNIGFPIDLWRRNRVSCEP